MRLLYSIAYTRYKTAIFIHIVVPEVIV